MSLKLNQRSSNSRFRKIMILSLLLVMAFLIKCQMRIFLSVFGSPVIRTSGSKIQNFVLLRLFISKRVLLLNRCSKIVCIANPWTM